MRKLLRADLYKLFHSKLFLFTILGGIAFSLFMAGSYKLIDLAVYVFKTYASELKTQADLAELITMLESIAPMITWKMEFLSQIPFGESYGIILTVVISIYLGGEFSSGVMRNKIIAGASRRNIYLSSMIITSIMSLCIMMVTWISNLLLAFLFFNKGAAIEFSDIKEVLLIMAYTYVVVMVYVSGVVLIVMGTRSTVLSLILGVIIPIIGTSIFSIVGMAINALPNYGIKLLSIFPSFQTLLIGGQQPLSEFWYIGVGANIIWISGAILEGIHLLKKADLK